MYVGSPGFFSARLSYAVCQDAQAAYATQVAIFTRVVPGDTGITRSAHGNGLDGRPEGWQIHFRGGSW
jgi:hypothetical protein